MSRSMRMVQAGWLVAAIILSATGAVAMQGEPASGVQKKTRIVHVSRQKEPDEKFRLKKVKLVTNEAPGTIIVDTNNKFLYYVEGENKALRYGIGVGREGFGWSGVVKIARKAEWPDWTPPPVMIARERKNGHILPPFMKGGQDNPLGSRAMYLHNRNGDSGFRIHGTNQPWSIGQNMSSGCIRMMNKDVEDLYSRAEIGSRVIVIGPGDKQGAVYFEDRGVDFFRTLFGK